MRLTPISSGPGAPIFEPGPHTRIRRAPVRAVAAIHCHDGKGIFYGQILNISPGGCLLQTEKTLPAGTPLYMDITVPNTQGEPERIIINAFVCRKTSSKRRTYGIEFKTHDAKERRNLQSLYAHAME